MASVLITGASRGIGLETALAFGRAGHQVHATMRNPSQPSTLSEIATRENLPILVSAMDVDSDESVSEAIAAIFKRPRTDRCAGQQCGDRSRGFRRRASAIQVPGDHGDQLLRSASLHSGFAPANAPTPEWMHHQRKLCGRAHRRPAVDRLRASKWALEALSEGLAGEMKTFNVRVAIVEPGIIDTAMAHRIEETSTESHYRQSARFVHLIPSARKDPVSPSLVARRYWKSPRAALGNCVTQ